MSDVDRLRSKLQDWQQRLSGNDPNAITGQISLMLWRSALYRSINESRKYLPTAPNGELIGCGSLHEFLHDGYMTVHSSAIRRLVDDGDGNSLYNLIRDIKQYAPLLTRANVFQARKLNYDYEPFKVQAHETALAEADAKGQKAFFISGEGWSDAENWHHLHDELCRVSDGSRGPLDRPSKSKFERLLKALKDEGACVKAYVDHFIAHAATEQRRARFDSDLFKLSLAKLWRAERAIVRAANFIARCVVTGVDVAGVPTPQFDQFEHMSQSFATDDGVRAMHEIWERHTEEIEACRGWSWGEPLVTDADAWP